MSKYIAQQRYAERQRQKKLVKVTVWVPEKRAPDVKAYAETCRLEESSKEPKED